MTKRTLFIWIFLIIFGLSSMPEILNSAESKQAGKTEFSKLLKKRNPTKKVNEKRKTSKKKKTVKKKKYSNKKKKYSKKKKKNTSKKKKYSKKKKTSSKKKYSKKKKYTKKKKSTRKKYYAPKTNSGSVEYKVYKRNTENQGNLENIAPQKEIRKEPKKEGQ
jgi:hypothetical protein